MSSLKSLEVSEKSLNSDKVDKLVILITPHSFLLALPTLVEFFRISQGRVYALVTVTSYTLKSKKMKHSLIRTDKNTKLSGSFITYIYIFKSLYQNNNKYHSRRVHHRCLG